MTRPKSDSDLKVNDEASLPSHREYVCKRCQCTVRICRPCDRGNIYCTACAPLARAERLRRAQNAYRATVRGKEAAHRYYVSSLSKRKQITRAA